MSNSGPTLHGMGPQQTSGQAIHDLLARLSEMSLRQHNLTVTFDHLRTVVEKVVERFNRFAFMLAVSGGSRHLLPYGLLQLLGMKARGGAHDGGGKGGGGGSGGGGGGGGSGGSSFPGWDKVLEQKKGYEREKGEETYRQYVISQLRRTAVRNGVPISDKELEQLNDPATPTGKIEAEYISQEIAALQKREALEAEFAARRKARDKENEERNKAYAAEQEKRIRDRLDWMFRLQKATKMLREEMSRVTDSAGMTRDLVDRVVRGVQRVRYVEADEKTGDEPTSYRDRFRAEARKRRRKSEKAGDVPISVNEEERAKLAAGMDKALWLDTETIGTGTGDKKAAFPMDAMPVQAGFTSGDSSKTVWASIPEEIANLVKLLRASPALQMDENHELFKYLYNMATTARIMGVGADGDSLESLALGLADKWEAGLKEQTERSPDELLKMVAGLKKALEEGAPLAGHNIGFDAEVLATMAGGELDALINAAQKLDTMGAFPVEGGGRSSLDSLIAEVARRFGEGALAAKMTEIGQENAQKELDKRAGGELHEAKLDAVIARAVAALLTQAKEVTEPVKEKLDSKKPPTAPVPVELRDDDLEDLVRPSGGGRSETEEDPRDNFLRRAQWNAAQQKAAERAAARAAGGGAGGGGAGGGGGGGGGKPPYDKDQPGPGESGPSPRSFNNLRILLVKAFGEGKSAEQKAAEREERERAFQEKGRLGSAAAGIRQSFPAAVNVGSQMLSAGNPVLFQTLMDSITLVAGRLSEYLIPVVLSVSDTLQWLYGALNSIPPAISEWIAWGVKWGATLAAGITVLAGLSQVGALIGATVAALNPFVLVVGAATAALMWFSSWLYSQKKVGPSLQDEVNKSATSEGLKLYTARKLDSEEIKKVSQIKDPEERAKAARELNEEMLKEKVLGKAEVLDRRREIYKTFAETGGDVKETRKRLDSKESDNKVNLAEEEVAKNSKTRGLLMSLRATAASPQYSDIENAYKKVQLDVLSKDPMLLEMEKLNRVNLVKLIDEAVKGNLLLEQQAAALRKLYAVESPTR